jgi:hypothetical protein
MHRWETVEDFCNGDYTDRMVVPGGWIYRNNRMDPDKKEWKTVAMVFVPRNADAIQDLQEEREKQEVLKKDRAKRTALRSTPRALDHSYDNDFDAN